MMIKIENVTLKHTRIETMSLLKSLFELNSPDAKKLMDNMIFGTFTELIEPYYLSELEKIFEKVFYFKIADEFESYQEEVDLNIEECQKWYDNLPKEEQEYVDKLIKYNRILPCAQ